MVYSNRRNHHLGSNTGSFHIQYFHSRHDIDIDQTQGFHGAEEIFKGYFHFHQNLTTKHYTKKQGVLIKTVLARNQATYQRDSVQNPGLILMMSSKILGNSTGNDMEVSLNGGTPKSS